MSKAQAVGSNRAAQRPGALVRFLIGSVVLALVMVSAAAQAQATVDNTFNPQSDFSAIQNQTSLSGTWSSGSGNVKTGLVRPVHIEYLF